MLEFVFNSFVTLLVVVDALTKGYPEKRKREAAIRGTVLGMLTLFSLLLAPGSCISSVKPALTSSPACSACSLRHWRSSSSSTA